MKQKIVDFPEDGKYPPHFDPANYYSMLMSLERFKDAGWLSYDKLPKIIENSINSIKRQWDTQMPCGFYDDFGHSTIGYCNYLLHLDEIKDVKIDGKSYESFDSKHNKILFARLSFGPESRQVLWDRNSFDRIHISAYARRIIDPLDTQYISKDVLIDESIYFSMRWINDKFLDHTTKVLSLDKCFEELRATYFISREFDFISERDETNSRISKRSVSIPEEFRRKYMSAYISKEISKQYDEAIATSTEPERLKEKFDIWKRSGRYKFYKDIMPELGYGHVLNILSKHGDVKPEDFSQIKEMNHVEGVEYFLNKIVPAMKNFVDSKTI